MQQIPSMFDAVLQNQQGKPCWKSCKTPRKVMENFYACIEIFQPTIEYKK
jgi:hypothetical protein